MDLAAGPAPEGRAERGGGPGAGTARRNPAALTEAIHRGRRAAVVINARSRRGARHFTASCRELKAAGFRLIGTHGVRSYEELKAGLADAVGLHPDLLVVGGGDGTLSEAVRHLAHRDVALGVLPLGTTNNFARNLGIPMDPAEAVGLLARGRVVDVDLGRVGEHLFANMVSFGLSSEVAARVPAGLKRVMGRSAYSLTAAARLPAHQPFRARLVVGEDSHDLRTHQLNIANGNFHAGMPISRDGTADDQLLLVYALGGASRAALIGAIAQHALRGRHRPMTSPPFLVTDDLWLETDPVLPIDVDGEVVGHTPTRVTLAPQALRVMAGAGADLAD
jgi:diacylglycerol kinase (ATP)